MGSQVPSPANTACRCGAAGARAAGGRSAAKSTATSTRRRADPGRTTRRRVPGKRLDGGELGEAGLAQLLDDRIARRLLVVPGEGDEAHEVRVRGLEAVEPLERMGEAHHALLAADAGDLDRVGLRGHVLSVTSARRSSAGPPRGRARAGAPPPGRLPRAPRAPARARTPRGRTARRSTPPPRGRAAAPPPRARPFARATWAGP